MMIIEYFNFVIFSQFTILYFSSLILIYSNIKNFYDALDMRENYRTSFYLFLINLASLEAISFPR